MLKQLPNIITVLRILLLIPFVACLFQSRFDAALVLLFIAALSDALDGYLARRFNWRSWFGSVADPIADKLLLTVSYVSLGWLGVMPMWLILVVLGRDVLILGGSFAYWRIKGNFEGNPTWLGKLSTFVAMPAAVWTLLHLAWWPLPAWLLTGLYYAVAMLSIISAVQYVILGISAVRKHEGPA